METDEQNEEFYDAPETHDADEFSNYYLEAVYSVILPHILPRLLHHLFDEDEEDDNEEAVCYSNIDITENDDKIQVGDFVFFFSKEPHTESDVCSICRDSEINDKWVKLHEPEKSREHSVHRSCFREWITRCKTGTKLQCVLCRTNLS